MDILIWFSIFIFGTIIGSFLNVVILRYGTGVSIARGKSACFSCAKNLSWYEMLPIISFIALRGKCRSCRSKISWQYPLVEFSTGLLFLATCAKLNGFDLLNQPSFFSVFQVISYFYYFVILSILMVITVYDLRHKIIPDTLVFALAFISLMWLVANIGLIDLFQSPYIFNLIAGPILALPFFLMWLLSRGRWIGLGDAKLALGMGWFLGLVSGVSAVILGFWIGAAVSLLLILAQKLNLRGKSLTIKSEIPFAPFLILGLLAVFFFGFDVIGLSNLLAQ